MNLQQMISSELQRIYPQLKTYLADRYSSKYVAVVLDEIKNSLLRPSNDRIEELSFNTKKVYDACGKTSNQTRIWTFMQQSPKTRLVDIKFTGNIGRLSRVVLNSTYKDQIMYELLDVPTQSMAAKELNELEQKANKKIAVDPASLSSFIAQTEQSVRSSKSGSAYHDKLMQNLLRAKELYFHIRDQNTNPHLIEYWAKADTGREYGHYNSLQRQSTEVRNAALGHCHKYDFQAHSFAVTASLAKQIDPTIKIGAIEYYIRYRTEFRSRLAMVLDVPEDTIKRVFTSLGFGAKPINNPFNSIRKAFYSEESYNKLLTHTEFKFIIEDLNNINQAILNKFPNEDFDWLLDCHYKSTKDNKHKKTDSQRLAWIYQNSEAYITQRFIEIIREQAGLEPLMTVHDCVYYKQKLPLSVLQDAQFILREEYEYVKVEHEAIWPIGTDQQFNNRFNDYDMVEQEHKHNIQQEERAAQGFKNEFNTQSINAVSESQQRIDRIKWEQEFHRMSSAPDYEYDYEYKGE